MSQFLGDSVKRGENEWLCEKKFCVPNELLTLFRAVTERFFVFHVNSHTEVNSVDFFKLTFV